MTHTDTDTDTDTHKHTHTHTRTHTHTHTHETGGFSRVLGVVGIISIFMCYGDDDQLMNMPIAAVVIFSLLMCVKCLLLPLAPFFCITNTHTHARTHARTHAHSRSEFTYV